MALVASENKQVGKSTKAMEIFLQAGELYFGSAPTIVSTMLHSRTVITFWHPATRIGGMCHVVRIESPAGEKDMQYGDCAIAEFADLADKYYTPKDEYEVRIFDGRVKNEVDARQHEIVLDALSQLLVQHGFKAMELDGFADSSRKITLDMANGSVAKREIGTPKAENKRELTNPEKSGDIAMEIFLHPGEIYFGRAPTIISTLLGSCVAVTLWHPKEKLGGMCHIVLPVSPDGKCEMKYGNCALAEFVKEATRHCTLTKDYIVNIYGGSDMFPGMRKSEDMKIGERNLDKVKELLKLFKFKVSGVDTGGTNSRKIRLNLSDGSVGLRVHGNPVDI